MKKSSKSILDLDHSEARDYFLRKAKTCEKVNHKVFYNKDGKYAYRPMQLINPVLYVSLVCEITTKNNWEFLKKRFKEFAKNKRIQCLSLPRKSCTENSDKAEGVSNWWREVEQRSIEMALDYSCLTHTDLTDCYGAIYTHSVAWSLHGKEWAKKIQKGTALEYLKVLQKS